MIWIKEDKYSNLCLNIILKNNNENNNNDEKNGQYGRSEQSHLIKSDLDREAFNMKE